MCQKLLSLAGLKRSLTQTIYEEIDAELQNKTDSDLDVQDFVPESPINAPVVAGETISGKGISTPLN